MRKKELYTYVEEYFRKQQPEPETELTYDDPFQLLVAVILSAQCTDARVNIVTPKLFAAFPSAKEMAKASAEEIFPFIKSISYPNNKSRHLAGMAKMLVEDFGEKVPATPEELQKLPGVGRKTANVIASVVYDQPTMPVDTHVFRVANRIGLVNKTKTPLQTEMGLKKYIPDELVHNFHHWLILHGRYICKARRPLCEQCGLTQVCKYYQKVLQTGVKLGG